MGIKQKQSVSDRVKLNITKRNGNNTLNSEFCEIKKHKNNKN